MALLLTLWVLTIFGLQISGAHYNPAVSLAYMLRKDVGRFPRVLGLAYMGAQVAGAYIGALIAWFLLLPSLPVDLASGLIYPNPTWQISSAICAGIIGESIGSFIMVFFYLTQTEEKTTFSKEKAINCFIIASSLVAGRAMVQGQTIAQATSLQNVGGYSISGAVLNPAIALGTTLVMLIEQP